MLKREKIIKNIILFLFIALVVFSMSRIHFFNNNFMFVVPFATVCFFYKKVYGVMALIFSFAFLGIVNKWFFLVTVFIAFSFFVVSHFIKGSSKNLKNILCFYNFMVVALCGIVSNFIYKENMYILSFFSGVISYWLMYYFYDFYRVSSKSEDCLFDSKISSFLFILLGVCVIGLDIRLLGFDVLYILLLVLSFLAVKVGLEVGCIYTLGVSAMLLLDRGFNYDILYFACSFLIVFFLSKVSKITFLFTYVLAGLFVFNYFGVFSAYKNVLVASFLILLIPKSFVSNLCKVCYGNDFYVQKMKEDSKIFNFRIANKIVKMEEVFSLVCEKINIKERIKKNDRKLLIEEVNLFSELLKEFSNEIKSNYNFDVNYILEKEFYRCGVDLIGLNIRKNVFDKEVIDVCVRCNKKEIKELIVPLVNKVVGNRFELFDYNYNGVFDYYSITLKERKRKNLKYGISQKGLKSVCGDSYLVYESESKYIFAISDGMGVGEEAKESSKLALNLFQKFMDIGFDLEQTLKSLNSLLVGRYNKDSYSTLDLFVYDKRDEKCYFYKNGASDSYVVGRHTKIIKGNDLPLGIIEKNEYVAKGVELSKGDLLIMASDGVGELNCLMLEKIKNKEPQKISELLVESGQNINDDKTVFVIKVC